MPELKCRVWERVVSGQSCCCLVVSLSKLCLSLCPFHGWFPVDISVLSSQNDFPTRMSLVVWSCCGHIVLMGWIPLGDCNGKDTEQQAREASVNLRSHQPWMDSASIVCFIRESRGFCKRQTPMNITLSQRLWESARKIRPGLSLAPCFLVPSILHWKAATSPLSLQPWTTSEAAFGPPACLMCRERPVCIPLALCLLSSLDQNCLHT